MILFSFSEFRLKIDQEGLKKYNTFHALCDAYRAAEINPDPSLRESIIKKPLEDFLAEIEADPGFKLLSDYLEDPSKTYITATDRSDFKFIFSRVL